MRRLMTLIALVAVAALSAFAGKAAAHWIGSSQYVYRTGDLCITASSLMRHELSRPILMTGMETDQGSIGLGGFNFDCAWAYSRPAGWLWLYSQLYIWGPNANAWLVCWGSGWQNNASPASSLSRTKSWESIGKPCGSGYYGVMATAYVWNGAGAYVGGSNWSGYENL